jgi:adenosylhomocysteine nucleosidase
MNAAFSAEEKGIRFGVVVALPAEARALAGGNWRIEGGRPVCRTSLEGGGEILWVRSGVGPDRALAAARWLIRQNVASLAVIGVSGGLAPQLEPGQLIVADTVLDGVEPRAGCSWPCTGNEALLKTLSSARINAVVGPVVTVAEPVLTVEEKQALHRQTGALAVDMESVSVARVAAEAGVNCLVLRAVCDGADRQVPSALYRMVDGEGRLKVPVLLGELLRRPRLIADLLTMRRDFARALAALKAVMSNE